MKRKRMGSRKTSMILLAVLLCMSMTLAACSKSNNDGEASQGQPGSPSEQPSTQATAEEPTPINILNIYYGAEPPGPDNVVIKEIEKRTNTKLTITWVSPNSYNEKVNVTLASGDIPDLILIPDIFAANVRDMAEQGAFWEIEKYIDEYPNLKAYPKDSWENSRYPDGKIYGIPRVRALEGGMVNVRKDWLDKLNLKVPETIDELYNIMKAFTNDDPDGNGKPDTVGLVTNISPDGLNLGPLGNVLSIFQNANGGWAVDESGNLVNKTTDPSTKQALEWLQKAYAEGLIHKDFATLKASQAKDAIFAGTAGVIFEAASAGWVSTEGIRKLNPQGDMLPLVSLTGPGGKPYTPRNNGYSGVFTIPKSVSEAKMKKILAFLDYGASDEGYELGAYGFKDIHFTKEGEFYQQTEQAAKDIVSTSAFGQIFTKYNKYLFATAPNVPVDYYNRSKELIDQMAAVSVPDPSYGLYSDNWNKYKNDFNKKITDQQVKIILGDAPLDSWDDFAAKLTADPNWTKSMEEMNAAYHKKTGK